MKLKLNISLSQVTKPLGFSGSDKVFSSKTHLQYRMYKTVSEHTHTRFCLSVNYFTANQFKALSTLNEMAPYEACVR